MKYSYENRQTKITFASLVITEIQVQIYTFWINFTRLCYLRNSSDEST